MGKDKKKDKKKQGKGAEKTAAKTAKNAAKREKKERAKTGEPAEEDIESILAELAEADKLRVAVNETSCSRPSPRVHASFLANPSKDREYLIFGGEYYNGERVYVYNDLFRLKENRGELTWSQISSPNTPRPRSSHQAVATRSHMYVVGGEFTSPSQMQFYHHKDMWRLDLATSKWEEVSIRGGPTPRSGHRAALWRSSIFLFGGFYDTGHDVKYHNDAYLFDINEQKWTKLGEDKKGDNGTWPSPRSAVGLAIFEDTAFVYGGFTKSGRCLSSSDDSRGTVHVDLWSYDLRANAWAKVRRAGVPPTPRCGFSTAVHKKRNLVVFGGVLDVYDKQDLTSTFYNDVFIFRMDQRRWFPLTLRGTGKKGGSRRSKDRASSCSGWDAASALSELDVFERYEGEEEEEFLGRKAMRKAMRRAAIQQRTSVLEEEDEGMTWSDDEGADGVAHWGDMRDEKAGHDMVGSEVVGNHALGDDACAGAPGVGAVEAGAREADSSHLADDGSGMQRMSGQFGGVAPICGAGSVVPEEGQREGEDAAASGVGGGSNEKEDDAAVTLESLLEGLIMEPKQSAAEEAEEAAAAEERRRAEKAESELEGVARPRKRINAHVLVNGNDFFIFGGKVDADKVEVTLDDVWTLDLSKLVEYTCVQQLSEAASVWVEDEEEAEGSGDDEPPEDWDSNEEDDDDDEEEDDEEEEEDDEEDEDEEDEEEKAKRLEIERKKEEGRKKKEAAKREKEAAKRETEADARREHGSDAMESPEDEAQEQEGLEAMAAAGAAGGRGQLPETQGQKQAMLLGMADAALIHLYATGARRNDDISELLFMREIDPVRYLEVSMKIKSERSKTAEEEEELRQEAARKAEVSAAAAAKANLLTSRQARLQRGIELRRRLGEYPEESSPKVGEGLKDFFDRTCDYWTLTAFELLETTGKSMRRDGFNLAAQHFREVQPLLAEFEELLRMEKEVILVPEDRNPPGQRRMPALQRRGCRAGPAACTAPQLALNIPSEASEAASDAASLAPAPHSASRPREHK